MQHINLTLKLLEFFKTLLVALSMRNDQKTISFFLKLAFNILIYLIICIYKLFDFNLEFFKYKNVLKKFLYEFFY